MSEFTWVQSKIPFHLQAQGDQPGVELWDTRCPNADEYSVGIIGIATDRREEAERDHREHCPNCLRAARDVARSNVASLVEAARACLPLMWPGSRPVKNLAALVDAYDAKKGGG